MVDLFERWWQCNTEWKLHKKPGTGCHWRMKLLSVPRDQSAKSFKKWYTFKMHLLTHIQSLGNKAEVIIFFFPKNQLHFISLCELISQYSFWSMKLCQNKVNAKCLPMCNNLPFHLRTHIFTLPCVQYSFPTLKIFPFPCEMTQCGCMLNLLENK